MSTFTEEMRELLRSRGYDPANAARLEEEGMGPHELEHILKTTKPGERGSLEYTRGIKKRSDLGTYKDISKLPTALDKSSRSQWREEQWREPDVWVHGDYSSTAIYGFVQFRQYSARVGRLQLGHGCAGLGMGDVLP